MSDDARQFAAAREAKNKAKAMLREMNQVSAVGITQVDDHYAVKVNLEEDLDPSNTIPAEIDGIPVVVQKSGRIHKQGSSG